jgi:hypothetical protein
VSPNKFRRIGVCGEVFVEEEELVSKFYDYKKKNGPHLENSIWLDEQNKVLFGADENYSNTPSYDACFLSSKDNFLENRSFGMEKFKSLSKDGYQYSDIKKTQELIIEKTHITSTVTGKSVLVMGSGPSANFFDKTMREEYDQIWVCNDFYKMKKMKDVRVDLFYISNEIQPLKEPLEYMRDNKETTCCFEMTVYRDPTLTIKYKELFPERVFLFNTRLFPTLGVSQRLMALAALLGASKIGFLGIDGKLEEEFDKSECYTAYGNERKLLPKNQNFHSQNREYLLFWEYMMETFPQNIEFVNHGHRYASNITHKIFNSPTFSNAEVFLMSVES